MGTTAAHAPKIEAGGVRESGPRKGGSPLLCQGGEWATRRKKDQGPPRLPAHQQLLMETLGGRMASPGLEAPQGGDGKATSKQVALPGKIKPTTCLV